jgi:uncharacterized alkaline shock family protein YloU
VEVLPMPSDEPLTDEGVASPAPLADDDRPLVKEDVVATYVADTVRHIPGIAQLHANPWQALSERMRSEVPTKGVLIKTVGPGVIEVEVHVRVAWDVPIPRLAQEVQEQVARRVESLLDLEVARVTLYVDEIEGPAIAS